MSPLAGRRMDGALRIPLQEAKAKLDRGEAMALDVTSSLIWPALKNRIPGSTRVAPEEIVRALDAARPAADILAKLNLPAGREVVAFCT